MKKQSPTDASHCISVLFVCMGNICRSPTAEATFRDAVVKAGTADQFHIDSAGTHAYHIGHAPDDRSQEVAARHGVPMDGQKARKVTREDFDKFDHIIAMDEQNLEILEDMQPPGSKAKVSLLLSHDPDAEDTEVPDPYYGHRKGFELVFEWVQRGTRALADKLAK